mgnify:CR=1 FL=1
MARPRRKVRGIIEDPKGSERLAIRFKLEPDVRGPDGKVIKRGRFYKERLGRVPLSFAIAVLEKRKTEFKMGLLFPRRAKKAVPFGEIVGDFLACSKANKRTWTDDELLMGYWLRAFGDRGVDDIRPQDVEEHKGKLIQGRAPATVNRYLASLKTCFSLAVKNGKVDKNPVKAVKLYKENNARVRYLTEEEETALMREIPEDYRPLVTVALHTGLRRGELFGLRWEDVDFRTKVITVPRAKNGEARYVPMNEVVMETFGSRLAIQGVPLLTNKELMGHKTIAMTQRYAHLSPGHLREAVEGLCRGINSTKVSQIVSQGDLGVDMHGVSH